MTLIKDKVKIKMDDETENISVVVTYKVETTTPNPLATTKAHLIQRKANLEAKISEIDDILLAVATLEKA